MFLFSFIDIRKPCPEINYVHFGTQVGKVYKNITSWQICRIICMEVPLCDKFAYLLKRKFCYLKSGGVGGSRKNGALSGLHRCKLANPPTLTGTYVTNFAQLKFFRNQLMETDPLYINSSNMFFSRKV